MTPITSKLRWLKTMFPALNRESFLPSFVSGKTSQVFEWKTSSSLVLTLGVLGNGIPIFLSSSMCWSASHRHTLAMRVDFRVSSFLSPVGHAAAQDHQVTVRHNGKVMMLRAWVLPYWLATPVNLDHFMPHVSVNQVAVWKQLTYLRRFRCPCVNGVALHVHQIEGCAAVVGEQCISIIAFVWFEHEYALALNAFTYRFVTIRVKNFAWFQTFSPSRESCLFAIVQNVGFYI